MHQRNIVYSMKKTQNYQTYISIETEDRENEILENQIRTMIAKSIETVKVIGSNGGKANQCLLIYRYD